MELEQRVTDLERRLAELEGLSPPMGQAPSSGEGAVSSPPSSSEFAPRESSSSGSSPSSESSPLLMSPPATEGGRPGTGIRVDSGTGGEAEPLPEPDFWALQHLKVELADLGRHDGGVLFTGSVRLPTHERYEWQYGALTDQLLDEDWEQEADAFAALGHGVRLRLLREVLAGRRTAAELTELDGMGTTGQVYHHLRQLTGAGWLHAAGRGRYEVPPGRVVPLLVMLSAVRP